MENLGAGDPQRIGAYRLVARLGAGGMGQVYLARSGRGRTVAVKLVRRELAEQEEFRARFRQEVQAARRVGGYWTAPVLDADTEAPVPWVATGYVAGPSLQQVVGRDHGALPERSVRILAAGLAHALQDIHAAGLVHRDLKPSNVLVTIDGPRVIDFGIARALETVTDGGLTRTGALVGSPGFMAPEQVRGDRITPACDVFCLGSVLAYAATGVLPFGGADDGAHALMFRIAEEEPVLEPVPEGIADLVRACLRKDPAARPTLHQVLQRTGAEDTVADGRSRDPWLPGALVAQLGRHAVRLLDAENAEEPGQATEPGPTAPAPLPQGTPGTPAGGAGPAAGAPSPSGTGPTAGGAGAAGVGAARAGAVGAGAIGVGAAGSGAAGAGAGANAGVTTGAGAVGAGAGAGGVGAAVVADGAGAHSAVPGTPPAAPATPGASTPPGSAPATPAAGTPGNPGAGPGQPADAGAPVTVMGGPAAGRPYTPGAGQAVPAHAQAAGASVPAPPPPAHPGGAGPARTDHLPTVIAGPTPPPGPAPAHPAYGHPQQPAGHGHPQPAAYGYPQQPAAYGYPQQPAAYGYPQQPGGWSAQPGVPAPHPYGGLGPTPPYGPPPVGSTPPYGPNPLPAPEPARADRRSTALLVALALVVALGAGGSVYALMRGGDGNGQGNGRPGPTPTAGASTAEGSTTAEPSPVASSPESASPSASPSEGAVPAAYVGTWTATIDNASGVNTRQLVISQGEVGDSVLTLVADGPSGSGTYHCEFTARLIQQPAADGSLQIGPSTVTAGEPLSSCTPGAATEVTLLPDGTLDRVNTSNGEKLTYARQ
ncbi:serine/threonine-protein kinase [Streptomyces sp. NPDC046831]|uniref:serine/threonine-protein kinase n=1 Tax=Streptomyces sp. NPDC046831 TaxID=3154805 RepID=UPI0033CE5292